MRPGVRRIVLGSGAALVALAGGLLTLLLLGVVGGAEVGTDDGHQDPHPSVTVPPTTTPEPTTTTAAPPDPVLGNGNQVVFAFGGDSHFEGHLRTRLAEDPASILAPVAPVFALADISIVNLETAITERGTPVNKQYTFRAPATAVEALRLGGVDAAILANNHGIDYGPEGLEDTLWVKGTSDFPLLGVGRDAAEAYAPWRTEVRGQRIAVFGASEVIDSFLREPWTATDTQPGMASAYPEDVERLLEQIRLARDDSDTIVVYLHWGRELETCPNERQRVLAQRLTEAGADIVVGAHSHRLQGAGRYGDAFVAYGLGNFVWYNESGASGNSGVLLVSATGRRIDDYGWVPARIRGGSPTPLEGAEADAARAAWEGLRDCTDLAP